MYAKLKGKIIDIFPEFIILEVNNVGYKLEAYNHDYMIDQEVELYIYTHVREQEISLFGFKAKKQYLLFMDLIGISGIGPKSALVLLSEISVDEVLTAIAEKDDDRLKVKGIGKKTAQRIIIEMSNKVENYQWEYNSDSLKISNEFRTEARDALLGLGFQSSEINTILDNYSKEGGPEELEELVKYALKLINKIKSK